MSDTLEVGRIGWWRFTNGSLLDESGYGLNLTKIGNPVLSADADGVLNNAYSGLNRLNYFRVAIPDTLATYLTKDVSFCCFFYNTGELGDKTIFQLFGSSPDGEEGLFLTRTNTKNVFRTNLGNVALMASKNCIGISKKAGVNGYTEIFVNGVKILSANIPALSSSFLLFLGAGYCDIGTSNIDEVTLYNRILTENEFIEINQRGVNYNPDTTPPSFNSVSIDTITYNSANLNVNSNETGYIYYKVLPRDSTVPTSQEVKDGKTGLTTVESNQDNIIVLDGIDGLMPDTQYDLYVVAEDIVPNLQLEPTKIQFQTLSSQLKVSTPTSNVASGTYTEAKLLVLSCTTDLAEIRYTTDGTEPTESSPIYSYPITIPISTTIKAKAFKAGYVESDTLIIKITITPTISVTPTRYIQPPKITIKNNIVSMESQDRIYYTTDGSYPTITSLRYTEPFILPPNVHTITAIAHQESSLAQQTIVLPPSPTIYPPQ